MRYTVSCVYSRKYGIIGPTNTDPEKAGEKWVCLWDSAANDLVVEEDTEWSHMFLAVQFSSQTFPDFTMTINCENVAFRNVVERWSDDFSVWHLGEVLEKYEDDGLNKR